MAYFFTRNAVEGKIGESKWRYGLDLKREKLAVTEGSNIAINILVMNLQKLLELLLCFLHTSSSFCSTVSQRCICGSRD